MSYSPHLYPTMVRTIAGTLSTDAAETIDLAALFDAGDVVGFEIKNTHEEGDLFWNGQGTTATTSDAPVTAEDKSSGFIPSNDKTLSLIREAGVAVTYVIVAVGR